MKIDYRKLRQGRYEAERLPNDFSPDRIVPDFGFNVLNHMGLLYRPVVDEDFLKNGGRKTIWPQKKTFAVCLTHDVDYVSLNSMRQWLRPRVDELRKRNSPLHKIKGLVGIGIDMIRQDWNGLNRDPIHCYERWIDAEKEIIAHSTFFFWPGWSNVAKRHNIDCSYELDDHVIFDKQKCTVAEMICEIAYRGFEIGLHSSWYSFNNAEELKRQKDSIERVLGNKIVSVRQHCLHYDIRITPRIQAEAGFYYDSSIGFNDNVGFRFGTCYPWYLYDLIAENELSIMEIPLIVQDGALLKAFKGLRLDNDTAFQYIVRMTEAVEEVGGVLTLLWHPSSIHNMSNWKLYLRILKYLKKKDPWFASVREVGEWLTKIQTYK